MGVRPGNFAIQNSVLVLSIGCRLSIRQVGYNYKTWARAAYVIVNDIDEEELKKPSVHVDMPVHADAADLLSVLDQCLDQVLEAENGMRPALCGRKNIRWYRKNTGSRAKTRQLMYMQLFRPSAAA